MRFLALLLAGTVLASSPAFAADQLRFGKSPTWVKPQTMPSPSESSKEAPVAVLLHDQQIDFEPGKVTTYLEIAIRIQKPEGLDVANVAVSWNPATDTVTVNKLEIRRGKEVIDVLGSGQTFTTMRRETNLDSATLDGMLTATLQPEALQVGDTIVLATTTEHVDPVLKSHVEASFADWNGTPIGNAHSRLSWPASMDLHIRRSQGLPKPRMANQQGRSTLELSQSDVEPLILPTDAPLRFQLGRFADATDFDRWSNVAELMAPLYEQTSTVPATGPLRNELEKIRSASSDPKTRAEMALELVQSRVRYVALLMGEGGYVPADPQTTWSRRFGDCKGKTALLLALLRELGVEAEPVAVSLTGGDTIPERLPMVGVFNHVLVRAHVGGKSYWLDGTSTGDGNLDWIQVPNFGWGLPLIANADLVRIVPPPLQRPETERTVTIDAAKGVFTPVPFTIDEIYRGDSALQLNVLLSQASSAQKDQILRSLAKTYFDSMTMDSADGTFDKAAGEYRISIKGEVKLGWDNGWLYLPTTGIAYNPDFQRAAGPLHDAPFATTYPTYRKDKVLIHLPPALAHGQRVPTAIRETLAGVEYVRTAAVTGNTFSVETSERSLAPEIPYEEALAAEARLRALDKEDVYLRLASGYQPGKADLSALSGQSPTTVSEYMDRGNTYLDAGRLDEAIADFTKAHELDPNDGSALAHRGLSHAWKREFDQAANDFAAAEKMDPSNSVILRGRGVMAELKGDFAAAVEQFSKSLQKDGESVFALIHRGYALIQLRKIDEAIVDFSTALASDPKDADALTARAAAYVEKGDLQNAQHDIDALEKIASNRADKLRALINLRKNDVSAAEENLSEAIRDNPDDVGAALKRAEIRLQSGRPKEAIADFTAILAKDPGNISALIGRAGAYHQVGDDEKALADTTSAAKNGSIPPPLRLLRANIFRQQGKHDQVLNEAKLLVEENPKGDFALVAAAKLYSAEGHRERAMETFEKALAANKLAYIYVNRAQVRAPDDVEGKLADLDEALKLEPDNPEALDGKATLLSRQGRYKDALAAYDQAIKAGHDSADLRINRAALLYKTGEIAEAEKLFQAERAIAKTPLELNNLCWKEATMGILLEQALEACREAIKISGGNPGYKDSLGMALLRSGKLSEAIAAYSEVIEKSPIAESYMGRAIAYSLSGDSARAAADRMQAVKLDRDIEAKFADYGLRLAEPQNNRVSK